MSIGQCKKQKWHVLPAKPYRNKQSVITIPVTNYSCPYQTLYNVRTTFTKDCQSLTSRSWVDESICSSVSYSSIQGSRVGVLKDCIKCPAPWPIPPPLQENPTTVSGLSAFLTSLLRLKVSPAQLFLPSTLFQRKLLHLPYQIGRTSVASCCTRQTISSSQEEQAVLTLPMNRICVVRLVFPRTPPSIQLWCHIVRHSLQTGKMKLAT